MTKPWKNEDDIKAELRVLTDELRTLRRELRNMVAPPKLQNPSRAFLQRDSWSAIPAAQAEAAQKKRESRSKKTR